MTKLNVDLLKKSSFKDYLKMKKRGVNFINKELFDKIVKKAEADGNPQEMIDKGDYGADTDNYKKDRSRMKGKSETSKPAGNPQEMLDKGDYTLAKKDGKIIVKGIKSLKEAMRLKRKFGGVIQKIK